MLSRNAIMCAAHYYPYPPYGLHQPTESLAGVVNSPPVHASTGSRRHSILKCNHICKGPLNKYMMGDHYFMTDVFQVYSLHCVHAFYIARLLFGQNFMPARAPPMKLKFIGRILRKHYVVSFLYARR